MMAVNNMKDDIKQTTKYTRLQKILSKRTKKQLSDTELQDAYIAFMEFAFTLAEMIPNDEKTPIVFS